MRAELVYVATFCKAALRPMQKERHTMSAVILGAFSGAHTGIEAFPLGVLVARPPAGCRAVVSGEDEDRVLGQFPLVELLAQRGDIFVDVLNHAVEFGHVRVDTFLDVGVRILRLHKERAVRCIGRDVGEERLVFVALDKRCRFAKEDVGAITFVFCRHTVAPIGIVEIVVVPPVRALADSAGGVANSIIKTLVFRAQRIIVAEMPFAEHAARIAAFLQYLGDGFFVGVHHGSAHDRVPDAGVGGVAAGHQRGPCRRAGRVDMVVSQADALAVELVHRRRVDHGIAMGTDVAVALIISDYQDDVWFGCENGRGQCQRHYGR